LDRKDNREFRDKRDNREFRDKLGKLDIPVRLGHRERQLPGRKVRPDRPEVLLLLLP
jgi:hypothetical protein